MNTTENNILLKSLIHDHLVMVQFKPYVKNAHTHMVKKCNNWNAIPMLNGLVANELYMHEIDKECNLMGDALLKLRLKWMQQLNVTENIELFPNYTFIDMPIKNALTTMDNEHQYQLFMAYDKHKIDNSIDKSIAILINGIYELEKSLYHYGFLHNQ